jgi:hypothetical protein
MLWSGVVTIENDAMNFHRYYVAPKKILTSMTLEGNDHFMMAFIFVGFILNSPPSITYSKYTNDY